MNVVKESHDLCSGNPVLGEQQTGGNGPISSSLLAAANKVRKLFFFCEGKNGERVQLQVTDQEHQVNNLKPCFETDVG